MKVKSINLEEQITIEELSHFKLIWIKAEVNIDITDCKTFQLAKSCKFARLTAAFKITSFLLRLLLSLFSSTSEKFYISGFQKLPPQRIQAAILVDFGIFIKLFLHIVGKKARGWIWKWWLQENKARKIFQKTNLSYPLILSRTCAYQRVRKVSFSEKFTVALLQRHN